MRASFSVSITCVDAGPVRWPWLMRDHQQLPRCTCLVERIRTSRGSPCACCCPSKSVPRDVVAAAEGEAGARGGDNKATGAHRDASCKCHAYKNKALPSCTPAPCGAHLSLNLESVA